MNKTLIWIFLSILSVPIYAQQFPSEIWHKGKVVSIESDTLKGNVKYNLQLDIVQVERNDKIITISAQKIYYFEIFDETVDNFRYFYSLPFGNDRNYETPTIFEVLHEGKMSLLTRERVITETVSQYSYYSPNYVSREKLAYDFFFLREKGKLKKYTQKKNELETEFMRDKADQIKKFIKKNKLKYDKKADLVRIVYFYNTLI